MTELLSHADDRALLANLPSASHEANGVPSPDLAGHRCAAVALVEEVLADRLHVDGIRSSPLGPGWSRDIDCHLTSPPPPGLLEDAGWLCLDPLLQRLGHRPSGTWAVVDGGRVLAVADLHDGAPPTPLDAVLDRCRRRGEVRLREVLELRALRRRGVALPDHEVVRAAAAVEHGLGGDLLSDWSTGAPSPAPSPLSASAVVRLRRRTVGPRQALRPRVVVALSGVDGAGKSSVAAELVQVLERCGVPTGRVWTRPGMSVTWFKGLRRRIKAALREGGSSGLQRRAAQPDAPLQTRSGVLGTVWSSVVCASFIAESWRQHRRAIGVVVHDRHAIDALVTLDLVYGGVDLRVQKALTARLLPAADIAVYLEVTPEVAARRKPDDLFGVESLRRQIEGYEELLPRRRSPQVTRLDGTTPSAELARQVLALLLAPPPSTPPSPTRRRMTSIWRRSSAA